VTLRLGALLSGGGRTLLNLADVIDRGDLDAEVVTVLSSREDAAGVARARDRGFAVHVADGASPERDDFITNRMVADGVDLVVLCGYLRWMRIDPPFVGRVLNIHPALLPKYGGRGMYGDHVHQAVLETGDSESGCTVHVVDEIYDHGPVILQRRCPVHRDDTVQTLAARVFAEECIAYPEAISLVAADLGPAMPDPDLANGSEN